MTYRRAISLFSNCGAGDVGYKNAGFRFDVMAELDARRLEVCLLNHKGAIGVPGDLRETWPQVIEKFRSKAGNVRPSLLAACPPCQGMSSVRSKRGREDDPDAGSKDERNLLVTVISQVALELRPSVVVVENVPAFLTKKVRHPVTKEAISAAKLLIESLRIDYQVFPIVADLCDYGVPQTRKRAFLTFVRRDVRGLKNLLTENRAPYPRPTHFVEYGGPSPITLRHALESFGLPSLDASTKERATSQMAGGLHSVPIWQDRMYDMVSAIPTDMGASAWQNDKCGNCGVVEVEEDDAICRCCGNPLLRPVVINKEGAYRLIKGFRSSSYRRMSPDQPASTITTASGHVGSDNTIHPSENRLLSTLECALIQTFPEDFNWGQALKKWGHTNLRSMIGEAVPPHFTRLHGAVLHGLLTGNWTIPPISIHDTRCKAALKRLGYNDLFSPTESS